MSDTTWLTSCINAVKQFFLTLDPTPDAISVASAIIAVIALFWSVKTSRKQIKLQKEQVELQRRQVALEEITASLSQMELDRIQEAQNKTAISIDYRQQNNGVGTLLIQNQGAVTASNILLWHESNEDRFHYMEIGDAAFCESDKRKVKIAAISEFDKHVMTVRPDRMGGITFYWTWKNPDGSPGKGHKNINLTV